MSEDYTEYTADKMLKDYDTFLIFFFIEGEERYIEHMVGYKGNVNVASLEHLLKELKTDPEFNEEFKDGFDKFFVDILYDKETIREVLMDRFKAEDN